MAPMEEVRKMATTNEEPDGGKAPAQTDAASGTPSNGPSSAKKRLLPMELRRRRRAAKLQITSERDVATISARDIIESLNEKESPEDAAATVDREKQADPKDEEKADESPALEAVLEKQVSGPEPVIAAAQTVTSAPLSTKPSGADEPKTSRPSSTATISTTKQLQNLFSFSSLDRKRQKLQHRESLVDVPTYMKVERMPIDLAPKSKVVITMPFAFPFARPRAASMAAAMSSNESADPAVRWIQALQYYVHPASSLPPSLSAVNEKNFEENDFYVQRYRTWQESFRHAYFGFRRLPASGALYVRYPEFMVCFYVETTKPHHGASIMELCRAYVTERSDGDGDTPKKTTKRLCAVISQSNARLRKELHRRGVEFSVPFNLRAMQRPISSSNHPEDELASHAIATSGPEHSVHGPDSLLRVSGHEPVHGLFEFLLNRKPHSNQDVPEILAHHAFANAAIRPMAVRYMARTATITVSAQENGDSTVTQGTGVRSEIELSGFCSTSAITKLMRCLEDSQGDDPSVPLSDISLKAAMETAPMAERLNAVFLDDNRAINSTQTAQQREAWKQQLDFAKRRLQTIKTVGGTAAAQIEMTTR